MKEDEILIINVFWGQAIIDNLVWWTWLAGVNRSLYELLPISKWQSQKEAIEIAKETARKKDGQVYVFSQSGDLQKVIHPL